MRSAVDFLPRCRILLTIWVTSTDRYTGSGMRSRRGAGPLRGIGSAFLLGAVAAASLLAVAHPGGVEGAADDLVADTREVLHPAATHEHDRVLLEVVPLTGDVRGDLDAARQAHAGDLAERGVGLLGGMGEHARAHAAALGRALERRRLDLRRLRLAALADKLLDRGHSLPRGGRTAFARGADRRLTRRVKTDRTAYGLRCHHTTCDQHLCVAVRGQVPRTRGNGFRRPKPEVIGAESGTYDLGLRLPGPIASGSRLSCPRRPRRRPRPGRFRPARPRGGPRRRPGRSRPGRPRPRSPRRSP